MPPLQQIMQLISTTGRMWPPVLYSLAQNCNWGSSVMIMSSGYLRYIWNNIISKKYRFYILYWLISFFVNFCNIKLDFKGWPHDNTYLKIELFFRNSALYSWNPALQIRAYKASKRTHLSLWQANEGSNLTIFSYRCRTWTRIFNRFKVLEAFWSNFLY